MRCGFAACAVFATLAGGGAALGGEIEFGVYMGANQSPHSSGTLTNTNGDSVTTVFGWDGASFEPSPYYGVHLIYWPEMIANWGVGFEFNHAKSVARLGESGGDLYSHLEFTDGLNLWMANVFHKWEFDNGIRTFVGAGGGLAYPNVEITTTANNPIVPNSTTFEGQWAGAAVQVIAGASWEFQPGFRLFGQYKLSYTTVDASLSGGVGTFSTDLLHHHIGVGLSVAIDDGSGF